MFLVDVRRLRKRIGLLGIVSLVVMLPANAFNNPQAVRKDPDNRQSIAMAVHDLVSAWNQHDAEAIAGLFLPDAVLVMPTGNVAKSRSGIRRKLLDEWSGKLRDTTLSHTVEDVAVLDGDTAVVKGRYRLNGLKVFGFDRSPEGAFVFRHKKQQGHWMISIAELGRDN